MKTEFTTPIKRARGLGSAHSGAHHWLNQRVSAIALLFLSLWFVISLAHSARMEYEDFLLFWSFPINLLFALLTIVVGLYHAFLGLQIVIEDYIHHHGWRFFWVIIIKFMAVLLASLFVYGGILLMNWN